MVEAPGTAPGSEWFITTAIYRHSRQAGFINIGPKAFRKKSQPRRDGAGQGTAIAKSARGAVPHGRATRDEAIYRGRAGRRAPRPHGRSACARRASALAWRAARSHPASQRGAANEGFGVRPAMC